MKTKTMLNSFAGLGVAITATSAAWLRGMNPYEPMLFWTGIAVLLVSFIARRSLLNEVRN